MKQFLILTMLLTALAFNSMAQSNPLEKKMAKVQATIEKGEYDKAEEQLVKLLKENPDYGDGWNLLVRLQYALYERDKKLDNALTGKIEVKENGKTIQDDSLTAEINKLLASVVPSKKAYEKYCYTLRKATLLCKEANHCAILLRNMYVDKEIDTNISRKALKYYNEAEEEFTAKNYNKAAVLYQRAVEQQPDFYKARLYLGDCYYFTGNYSLAIEAFKEASAKYPMLLEPRKFLVDAYGKSKLYEYGTEEAIKTFAVYPDPSMCVKLDDVLYMNGQRLSIAPLIRGVFPNTYTEMNEIVLYNDPDSLVAQGPWVYYQQAAAKIKPYCNSKGIIIKDNTLTQSKYAEVYCWEEMLKNSNDEMLKEARRMQQANNLDCYVLVTSFHQDIYPQYRHFADKNADKIYKYFKANIRKM
jgi:tetratricopeptide (TPR) repeat protein